MDLEAVGHEYGLPPKLVIQASFLGIPVCIGWAIMFILYFILTYILIVGEPSKQRE
jgi:phage shock protein PspC (stress-responsive transcriptional regulator)